MVTKLSGLELLLEAETKIHKAAMWLIAFGPSFLMVAFFCAGQKVTMVFGERRRGVSCAQAGISTICERVTF